MEKRLGRDTETRWLTALPPGRWGVREGNPFIHTWGQACRPRVVSMMPLVEVASTRGDQLCNHVALSVGRSPLTPQRKRNEER